MKTPASKKTKAIFTPKTSSVKKAKPSTPKSATKTSPAKSTKKLNPVKTIQAKSPAISTPAKSPSKRTPAATPKNKHLQRVKALKSPSSAGGRGRRSSFRASPIRPRESKSLSGTTLQPSFIVLTTPGYLFSMISGKKLN